MAYEKPEYTIVGEATEVVQGPIKNPENDGPPDFESNPGNLALGLED